MKHILFFDTETSGLPKNYKAPPSTGDNWPRVIQLAFQVYNDQGDLVEEYESLIKPDGWTITEEAEKVHGISMDKAMDEGVDIRIVLENFAECINMSDVLVAHNLNFDFSVLASEFLRYGFRADKKPKLCTMQATTELMKLPSPYKKGQYKWPKLMELHEWLFNETFDGAHDALEDVRATARCFFELHRRNMLIVPEQVLNAMTA